MDLGAKVSILHKSFVFGIYPRPFFYPPKMKLRDYNGNVVPTMGIVKLNVEYENRFFQNFEFYVVSNGQSLMGLDLFDKIGFSVTSPSGNKIYAVTSKPSTSHTPEEWTAKRPCQSARSLDTSKHPCELPYHLFRKYSDLVSPIGLKVIKGFRHKPIVDPNVRPVAQPLRRIPQSMENRVNLELEQMVRDDILEPIDASPWVCNMVITPKPNDKIRICGDLRNTNKAIIPDKYPLPTIDELGKFFAGATVFSKIDLKSGYWQVDLAPESRYLTAMITDKGLFQWKRVPFRLSSAPSAF